MQQIKITLKGEDASTVFLALESLQTHIRISLLNPIKQFLTFHHPDIVKIIEKSDDILFRKPAVTRGEMALELIETEWPLCKVAVLFYRKKIAQLVEEKVSLTNDPKSQEILHKKLDKFKNILSNQWFSESSLALIPALSSYLNTQMAEGLLEGSMADVYTDRNYDEKFHILFAPEHFSRDLLFFRERCELRNLPMVVAYIDIDDFKAFNTEAGNLEVDRYVLPKFMFALESTMFFKRFAYRYGGDEYIATIPNCRKEEAAKLMAEFQDSCSKLDFTITKKQLTVSIGLFEVRPHCEFTNTEIEKYSEEAKDHSKTAGGKNCIVGYSDSGELEVISRNDEYLRYKCAWHLLPLQMCMAPLAAAPLAAGMAPLARAPLAG